MDNAMVKRGIGAVVLAIIAALLLGFLLKDKSNARQEIVDMKLPGAPEIPSLSDATEKLSSTATNLVNDAKDSASNVSNAVIDEASSTASAVTETVSSAASTATQVVENNVTNNASTNSSNPGFSIRPPTKNEEQQINTDSSLTANNNAANQDNASNNDAVVASSASTKIVEAKKFKPTIENEPKKVVKKKPAKKKVVAKKEPPKKAEKPQASSSGKYAIQLLATSSQSRANKLAQTMNSEGYVSYITQTISNNKTLYRVRVGGHKDRSTALSAQQSMKRRYQKNFNVQNSLVVSQ